MRNRIIGRRVPLITECVAHRSSQHTLTMLKFLRELAGPEADCPDYDHFMTSPLHASSGGLLTSSSGRRSLGGVVESDPDREVEGDVDPFDRWPLLTRLQSVHSIGTRFGVNSRSLRRLSTRLSSIEDERTSVTIQV